LHTTARIGGEAHLVQHLVDAAAGRTGCESADLQVPSPGDAGLEAEPVHVDADVRGRVVQRPERRPVDHGLSGGRPHETDDRAQRRRLSRAVRAEKPDDRPAGHRERQILDSGAASEPLREAAYLDGVLIHGHPLSSSLVRAASGDATAAQSACQSGAVPSSTRACPAAGRALRSPDTSTSATAVAGTDAPGALTGKSAAIGTSISVAGRVLIVPSPRYSLARMPRVDRMTGAP
ncbi:unnamed protein product, partial [Penicillium discolor]